MIHKSYSLSTLITAAISSALALSCCIGHAAGLTDGSAPDTSLSPANLTLATNIEADDHAPIGLMGDHVHNKGEFMISYRFMHMYMDGMQDDGQKISDEAVLGEYMVTPLRMSMNMHMLGAMVAPSDKVTLTAMVPYLDLSMSHRNRMGVKFNTRSHGFGDIKAAALTPLLKTKHHQIIAKAGVSFPTGSINQRDHTPAGSNSLLPYPMQLGSGTYDLQPGVTYRGEAGNWNWGVQGNGTIRLGRNDNNYRLGNKVAVSPWVARQWHPGISTSIRANAQSWGRIAGADSRLNPQMVPTANTYNQGGKRVDLAFGINLAKTKGFFRNHRLSAEIGVPVYQHLDGPQLNTQFFVTGGWQWTIN